MIDPTRQIHRRTLLLWGFLGSLATLTGGCGDEGAGTVKGPTEGGGRKRLKQMEEAAKHAAEAKAARKKR
jgi:hypothetical protein